MIRFFLLKMSDIYKSLDIYMQNNFALGDLLLSLDLISYRIIDKLREFYIIDIKLDHDDLSNSAIEAYDVITHARFLIKRESIIDDQNGLQSLSDPFGPIPLTNTKIGVDINSIKIQAFVSHLTSHKLKSQIKRDMIKRLTLKILAM